MTANYRVIDNLVGLDQSSPQLTHHEATELASFMRETIIKSNDNTYTPKQISTLTNSINERAIFNRAKTGYLIYARNDENEIVGCGMLLHGEDGVKLRYCYVDGEYRGEGVVDGIIEKLKKRIETMRPIKVRARTPRLPQTLEIYRRFGFKEVDAPADTPLEDLLVHLEREI